MSILDYFVTDTSKTQTIDEARDNQARLQAQLKAQTDARVLAGTISPETAARNYNLINESPLQSPGDAAGSQFLNSATFGVFGTPDPNQAEVDTGTGFGALAKDLLLAAIVATAIYFFVKLGGFEKIKKLVA